MVKRQRTFLLAGLLVALVLAGVVSFYASGSPDGLERVATDTGISEGEREHALSSSPLADYGVRGIGDPRLSGGIAGVIGVLVTFAVGGALFTALRRREDAAPTAPDAPDGREA